MTVCTGYEVGLVIVSVSGGEENGAWEGFSGK